jgi:hypothetical protein
MTTEVVVVNETNTVVTENTVTNVVEVMAVGTTATVDVIAEGPAGPPGGQVTVQDEGVDVAPLEDKLNFVGSMVNVTNNPATETVTVTVTAPSPTISLTGAVTGSGAMTNLGNVSIATTATADPTLTLAGDATGSATFTNLGDATLTVTVVDDSHNHIISNVDGLQDALDSKLPSASYTAADVLTKIKTVDGSGSGLDADLLDGESGAYYIDFTNATNKPDPTITLSGDATGSVTLTDLASGTLSVTVVDDSHNHIISNVDGLQDALDAKAPLASPTFTGTVTLPSATSVGNVSATEISYLDGVTSGIQSQIDSKLPSSSYTAADVLTKIKTVDGAGSGLDADLLDGQSSAYYTAINDRLGYTAENAANKGIANGYASLDGAGLVPSTQLPSYVDDVLEYANVAAFPATGVSGVIYVAIDTSKTYRWSGSTYVEISASPGTTDALTEGTVNLYFTTARARQSVSAGTGISYNNSTGVITNSAPDQTVALTAGTGISTSGTYPNFTITNSAPDQTVALTAGTGISTSGTYPNFTITNAAPDQTVVLTAGTGISTSGTYPNFTITNSAPDQTVALTGSGTTSISGTYPNFTISSADQYVGTVTSVSVSGGTTGLTVTGSPITSSGTITLGGTLAIINGGTGATTASGARTNLGLGTAATTDASAYATAAQGAKADTAVQTISSADGSVTITGTTAIDLSVAIAGATSNVLLPIRNTTGATLTKGTAVYISGATGQLSTVSKAIATSDATSAQTLGLITADLANNSNGNVTLIGTITNINTSAYSDGQQLYLSPTTAGTLTATKPYAPDHLVYMAVVEHAHPTQGKLFVKVQNGYELDELHDVSAQSPTNGQTIVYNSTSDLWEKNTVSLTVGVNGTLPVANGGTGQTSFTNGQLLIGNTTGNTLSKATLTAGTNVSITNGAGSITINATDQYVGTVTSVAALTLGTTGTDLSSTVANGTTTPVITLNVPTASASNRGALSSTDWSTFNGKQAALVSGSNIKTVNGTTLLGSGDLGTIGVAYGGTGATSLTSGYLLKGNGTSAVSASVVYDDGTNVGIGTSSPSNKLDVFGTSSTTMRSYSTGTASSTYAAVHAGTGEGVNSVMYSYQSAGWYGLTSNHPMLFMTNNSERMRIDSSGNVGIGTSSPSVKLDVVGNVLAREDNSAGANPVLIRNSNTGNNTTKSSSALFQGTDTVGTVKNIGSIGFFPDDANYISANLRFLVRSGDAAPTERMRIDSSGNVGIGTSAPAGPLHVVANTNSSLLIRGPITYGTGASLYAVNAANTVVAPMELAASAFFFNAGNVGVGNSNVAPKFSVTLTTGFSWGGGWSAGSAVFGGNGTASGAGSGGLGITYDDTSGGTIGPVVPGVAWKPLRFFSDNIQFNTNGGTEYMRLTSSGTLGLGLSAPNASLHIAGARGGEGRLMQMSTSNATAADALNIIASSSSGGGDQWYSWGVTSGNVWRICPGVGLGSSQAFSINSNSRVLVGSATTFDVTVGADLMVTATAGSAAAFKVNATSSTQVSFYDSTQSNRVGWIGTGGSSTSYNTTSDRRLKKNIQPVADCGDKIDQIEVVSHEWTNGTDTVIPYAFIAQDLYEAAPHAVSKGDDGDEVGVEWAVDYSKLVPMMIKEMQSMRARLAELEGK